MKDNDINIFPSTGQPMGDLRYKYIFESKIFKRRDIYTRMKNLIKSNISLYGLPKGPFYTQAPLIFNPKSDLYLFDNSFILPTEYDRLITDFISKSKLYLNIPANQPITEDVIADVKIFLWCITMRCVMDPELLGTPMLYAVISKKEYDFINDIFEFIMKESEYYYKLWILQSMMYNLPSTNTLMSKVINDDTESHQIILDVIHPWKINVKKELFK